MEQSRNNNTISSSISSSSNRRRQTPKFLPCHASILRWVLSVALVGLLAVQLFLAHLVADRVVSTSPTPVVVVVADDPHPQPSSAASSTLSSSSSCALCFFGLPRSFQLLVLPSIVKNVLIPNLPNRCDIYLHYYSNIQSEGKSRSGVGGTLDTEQVWLLQEAVDKIYNNKDNSMKRKVHLTIVNDTNSTFWKQRGEQIHTYLTAKAPDGKLLYYPWMAKSYDKDSIFNLIKQWHSIQEVWNAMERREGHHQLSGVGGSVHQRTTFKYDRIAMLRNDVVYVTPFDMYQINATYRDTTNRMVAVPNWARFPINDRMVYGPRTAIQVWAAQRFDRLETHVRTYPEPGYGLHSERFLDHVIFPAMQDLGYEVVTNPEICFFRARADGSCWINDCATRDGAALGFRTKDTQLLVEKIVGKKCVRSKFTNRIVQLQCKQQ